jgi:hypothetical protein
MISNESNMDLKKSYFYYVILVAAVILLGTHSMSLSLNPITEEMKLMKKMDTLLRQVQGDDNRIMRWDATLYTLERQRKGGCSRDTFVGALDVISNVNLSDQLRGRAAEYVTFCVTDNGEQRALLSKQKGIHAGIVDLVKSTSSSSSKTIEATSTNSHSGIDSSAYASAMACHLIYIASFADTRNHVGFRNENAVPVLAAIVKNEQSTPIQIMWAAAALQNLAASYCGTEDDGRCYWDWVDEDVDYLVISKNSLPRFTDGSAARKAILEDTELVDRLTQLACTGPVSSENNSAEHNYPFPGENAVVHRDELSPSIVPWAATGALTSLALDPDARHYLIQHHSTSMACFCRLSHSRDWLEANKGEILLHHLRRDDDPCWFDDPLIEKRKKDFTSDTKLCVDGFLYDEQGYTCSDYGAKPSEIDCALRDQYGVLAKDACCACGGGEHVLGQSVGSSQLPSV